VSLLELDPASIQIFPIYKSLLRGREALVTTRLGNIAEINDIDFLKIDIRDSGLSVIEHGRQKLSNAVAIQTEVSFAPFYQGQPRIGDVDRELRYQGFHRFAMPSKTAPIAPLIIDGDPMKGGNQLLEADLVYVRDFRNADNLSSEMLKHLALIASCCYDSIDLAYRCMLILVAHGDVESDICERYLGGRLQTQERLARRRSVPTSQ